MWRNGDISKDYRLEVFWKTAAGLILNLKGRHETVRCRMPSERLFSARALPIAIHKNGIIGVTTVQLVRNGFKEAWFMNIKGERNDKENE